MNAKQRLKQWLKDRPTRSRIDLILDSISTICFYSLLAGGALVVFTFSKGVEFFGIVDANKGVLSLLGVYYGVFIIALAFWLRLINTYASLTQRVKKLEKKLGEKK